MSESVLREQCRQVVRQLRQKYHWGLVEEEVWVDQVWKQAQQANGAYVVDLTKLAKAIYSEAWYAACKASGQRREQAFHELAIELYKMARQQYGGQANPQAAQEIAQTALVLVWEQLDKCENPAAFMKFCLYKLWNAGTLYLREEKKSMKHLEPLPDEGDQYDE